MGSVMENLIDSVKNSTHLTQVQAVGGIEALTLGESLSLYFKEFGNSIDNRMAKMTKSIHTVNVKGLSNDLEKRGVLFVKNSHNEILTPEGFTPGLGNMDNYVNNVVRAVYLVSSLKTEASRLYDWIKQIIKKGRIDKSFTWTITDFDTIVNQAETFIKELPELRGGKTYTLEQVYVNFEEYFHLVNKFNTVVTGLKHRDVELAGKELERVYQIGDLLVTKIEHNDITLDVNAIKDIEFVINNFSRLANITGAMMTLLNETSAVLSAQADSIKRLK